MNRAALNKAVEALIALDGRRASVSIIRAKDQRGMRILRTGTLGLALPADDVRVAVDNQLEEPIAIVIDETGLPYATFMGNDKYSIHKDLVSVEFRSSFRIDVLPRPFPKPVYSDDPEMTYERASRELAAELEAGLRTMLLFRPDPDPGAGVRARHGVPATAASPLKDGSIRFAVGHLAATLFPDDAGIRLMCVLSEVKPTFQRVHLLVPESGDRYTLDSASIERLGAHIRAFLFDVHNGFVEGKHPETAAADEPSIEEIETDVALRPRSRSIDVMDSLDPL